MKFAKAMITATAIFALAIPVMASNGHVVKESNGQNNTGYLNMVDNNSGGQQLLARGGGGRGGGNGAGSGSGHKYGTGTGNSNGSGRNGSAYGTGDETGQRGGGYGPGDGEGNSGGPQDGTVTGPKTGDCDQDQT